VHEPDAEPPLEVGDVTRDGGLRETRGIGGADEAACIHHRHETAHFLGLVHDAPFCNDNARSVT